MKTTLSVLLFVIFAFALLGGARPALAQRGGHGGGGFHGGGGGLHVGGGGFGGGGGFHGGAGFHGGSGFSGGFRGGSGFRGGAGFRVGSGFHTRFHNGGFGNSFRGGAFGHGWGSRGWGWGGWGWGGWGWGWGLGWGWNWGWPYWGYPGYYPYGYWYDPGPYYYPYGDSYDPPSPVYRHPDDPNRQPSNRPVKSYYWIPALGSRDSGGPSSNRPPAPSKDSVTPVPDRPPDPNPPPTANFETVAVAFRSPAPRRTREATTTNAANSELKGSSAPLRREVLNAMRALREMPPYARDREIDHGRYSHFTPEERDLLRNLRQ